MNTNHDALREALEAAQEFINDVHYGEWADAGGRRNEVNEKITKGFAALSQPMPEAAAQGRGAQDGDPAWQVSMAHQQLDRMGVPRSDNDAFYSVWGRFERAFETIAKIRIVIPLTGPATYKSLSASPAAPEGAKPEHDEDETPPSLPPNQYAEFWERLPGHLIDNHEGEELTEELLQRAAADLYATFPALVESGLKPFGLLLLEERATTRQLTRALREATEAPTFMGEPAAPVAAKPRCNYPECTRACGDAKGYCHKAAKPEPQAQATHSADDIHSCGEFCDLPECVAVREAQAQGGPEVVAWMREWEGDVSDEGAMLLTDCKEDTQDGKEWHPLITLQSHREALAQHRAALEECLGAMQKARPRVVGGRPAMTLSKPATVSAYLSDLSEFDAAITHANQVLEGGGK